MLVMSTINCSVKKKFKLNVIEYIIIQYSLAEGQASGSWIRLKLMNMFLDVELWRKLQY